LDELEKKLVSFSDDDFTFLKHYRSKSWFLDRFYEVLTTPQRTKLN